METQVWGFISASHLLDSVLIYKLIGAHLLTGNAGVHIHFNMWLFAIGQWAKLPLEGSKGQDLIVNENI